MTASLAQHRPVCAANKAPQIPTARINPNFNISFGRALGWDDVHGAFRLLYESYRKRGFIPDSAPRLRYTHFNLRPHSATFIARNPDQVAATVSLIPDSALAGVPMDELYIEELLALRNQGRKLGEISGLAIDPSFTSASIHVLIGLVRLVHARALELGLTDVVAACHPKHGRLFQRLFFFEEIGAPKMYESLSGAPAVAVRLDLVDLETRYRFAGDIHGFNLHQIFFNPDDRPSGCSGSPLPFLPDVLARLSVAQIPSLECRSSRLPPRAEGH